MLFHGSTYFSYLFMAKSNETHHIFPATPGARSPSVPFPWAKVSSIRAALPRNWTAPWALRGRDCLCLGQGQGIRQEKGWHGIGFFLQWFGHGHIGLLSGKLTIDLGNERKPFFECGNESSSSSRVHLYRWQNPGWLMIIWALSRLLMKVLKYQKMRI